MAHYPGLFSMRR